MERFGSTSHRVFSVRSIFTFVLVVLITTLLSVIISSQPTHAADTEASWSGDTIIYDGHGYDLTTDYKDTSNTIPTGSTVYQSIPQTGTDGGQKAFVLYFTPGVDPPTAKTAKAVEFTYSASTGLSNPKNATDVSLTLKGEQSEKSSCSVSGIGWIICPVSVFLAEAMDNVFNILSEMIKVQPSVLGDPNNSMYIAWNVMRNIANIAFVIVFLIIIYSQLTSYGVSNYGLKKLVPRLIIAAILVNVSFIVSALAIDISNILGYSIQNVFNDIRENVFNLTEDNFGAVNQAMENPWAQLTATVLAGGGVIGGVAYAAGGGLYMLIPLLLGLILTLIFVVIVLAARQAIIVILVIIAPVAFVANLLPNTEKWFDKWKDLFVTMLIFFPAFSLVFGGSQLAGQLIIQNAGGNIVTVIFGMAVQIAPLVITPLLLKFSGSLLGRIAQIANNPSKGILDRNKNWATSRAEHARNQNIAKGARWYNPASYGAGLVKNSDFRKRRLQDRTNAFKQMGENQYHESSSYEKTQLMATAADIDKNRIHDDHTTHTERLKATRGSALYDKAINAQASKERSEAATNQTSQLYNEQRIISGSRLNASTTGLEASKAMLESSENNKSTYLNRQRMMAGTVLNSTVAPLEASKLRTETAQNQYTNMVEGQKLNRATDLYGLAQGVQVSKEALESTQTNVQSLFDQQRRIKGTDLNISTSVLENSKSAAEGSKALTAAFINTEKATMGTELHTNAINAESAKMDSAIADARLTKVIENYKAGVAIPSPLANSSQLQTISDKMNADTVVLAAEKQAGNSAQYEIQRNIADVMTKGDSFAEQMLGIAQGVGGDTARFRAQAQFVKAATSLNTDALSANVDLLKEKAKNGGTNIKRYSNGLLEAVLDGQVMYDNEMITPEIIKAATQAQAEQKNVPLIERMKRSRLVDQNMLREIVALNGPALMGAGAYGLVDDPTLSIDNFASEEEFDHALNVQRVSNLANANSSGLGALKFGWVANSLAKPENLKQNIADVLIEINKGKTASAALDAIQNPNYSDPAIKALRDSVNAGAQAEASLVASYKTVRGALLNEDTLADMRDREAYLYTIEGELAKVLGQKPLENEKLEVKVDADTYSTMPDPVVSDIVPDISDSVEDNDDGFSPPTPEQE